MLAGADFETDWNDTLTKTWVAQWAIVTHAEEFYGTDIKGFFERCYNLAKNKNNLSIYFHNLKFDSSFMEPHFHYLYEIIEGDNVQTKLTMKRRNPFQILITWDDKNKVRRKIKFRDSAKKLPGTSVSDLGQVFMPENKGKKDGFEWKSGWSKKVDMNNKKSFEYIIRDAEIVYKTVNFLHTHGSEKTTLAGDSWVSAKNLMGRGLWLDRFPELSDYEDRFVRGAYWGGINWSNNKIWTGDIKHLDIKSSYPAIMLKEPLPYGKPEKTTIKQLRDRDLFVVDMYIKLDLRANKTPWYRFKSTISSIQEGINYTDPVVKTKFWHKITLTNIDLAMLLESYHVKIELETAEVLRFKSKSGMNAGYVNEWFRIKETATTNAEKMRAKYHLNGLSGRFGLRPEFEDWTYENEFQYNGIKPSEHSDSYIPMSTFITAYGRKNLLDGINQIPRYKMIHSDTDSMIYLNHDIDVKIGSELGDWNLESEPSKVYEREPKRYIEMIDNTPKLTCSGISKIRNGVYKGPAVELLDNPEMFMNEVIILGNENYKVESDWLKKLAGPTCDTRQLFVKRVDGGIILEPRQYKLNGEDIFTFRGMERIDERA